MKGRNRYDKGRKTIGIIGGMGSMATVDLFKKIIQHTPASSDQDHIPMVIDNNTSIPDRTTYILRGGENPAIQIAASAKKLISIGADILVMPCNTAHHFYQEVCTAIKSDLEDNQVIFLNMIDQTAKYVKDLVSKEKKVYLLATKGTYSSNQYSKAFGYYGIDIIEPNVLSKEKIMQLIYNYKNGNLNDLQEDLLEFKNEAHDQGAKYIILGCSELPLIFNSINYKEYTIDPTKILAMSAVNMARCQLNRG